MLKLLLIGVFGALGAISRALLSTWLNPVKLGVGMPWGTIAANLVGSVLIGVAIGLSGRLSEPWRSALTTGFLGSLTTFSTFNLETVELFTAGRPGLAAANLVFQVGLGLAGAAVGLSVGGYWGR
ncbi:MAG: CrcB protein [Myxococcota bacterium]|jgi:CrcB protein